MTRIVKDGLKVRTVQFVENHHLNYTHTLDEEENIYMLGIPTSGNSNLEKYNTTTKNIQYIINKAIEDESRIRAIGSLWSFTKVGIARNKLVETKDLDLKFRISKSMMVAAGRFSENELYMLQCGNTIMGINNYFADKEKMGGNRRAIMASGASNGQTIVGAISTGTHGSAFDVGALHDTVVAIHLITGPNSHVLLQRDSDPAINERFAMKLGAELISNDDIFNAVLVSFGSMGFIHSVILRMEPLYLLEKYRTKHSMSDDLKSLMDNLDFQNSNFPTPPATVLNDGALYHWGLVVNPYKANDEGVLVTSIYKGAYDKDKHQGKTLKERGYELGDQLLGVIGRIIQSLGALTRRPVIELTVNQVMSSQFSEDDAFPWVDTVGDTFGYTSIKGKSASMAMGIQLANTSKVYNLIENMVKNELPFPGVYGIRFVKSTKATLGFTKFDPVTTVFELDGPDIPLTNRFYRKLWEKMEEENIDFTLHWGKVNHHLNEAKLVNMYGQEKIDQWIATRNFLLGSQNQRKVFTNEFMEHLDLAKELPFSDNPIVA